MLTHHGRRNVQSLEIEQAVPPLPAVGSDWRAQAAQAPRQLPGNQARRERAGDGYPAHDGVVFGSRAELAVYQALVDLQRQFPVKSAIAVLPLPGAKLRDGGVRTPDFVVVGNGAPRSSRSTGATTTAQPARPTTPTATCTGGGAALTPSASPASTPLAPRLSKPRLEEELKRNLRTR